MDTKICKVVSFYVEDMKHQGDQFVLDFIAAFKHFLILSNH